MKKTNWFKILLYLSLVFLAFSLYKANYLIIPKVYSINKLIISIFFLFAGMIVMSRNWMNILKHSFKIKISLKNSIISNGLSVFTKYIPGKVMVIMGRAMYISETYQKPLKVTSIASLQSQVFMLWVGFLFSSLLFFFIELNRIYFFSMLLLFLAFSLFLFSKKANSIFSNILNKIIKKNIQFPNIEWKEFYKIAPSFIIIWFFWAVGFYLFAQSLSSLEMTPLVGLGFPLAATFAIVALISPGGLGVREGILAFSLIALNIDKQLAITISTASRLWFLLGEVFIFTLAIILKKIDEK